MSFLSRLFGTRPDPRERLRPLWYRTVEISREPAWYGECGVADTVPGRFDMIAAVLALVILRMETDPALAPDTARLTELFVEDMDWQLRESGVGDLMVGKHMGKLVSALGGRLTAYRSGIAEGPEAMAAAAERNVTLVEGFAPSRIATRLLALSAQLRDIPGETLIAGRIPR